MSWMSFLVIQRSQGHFLGHLGAPKLDFTDLGCVLGPPWESLSRQVGDNFVISDVKSTLELGSRFLSDFSRKYDLPWEVGCAITSVKNMCFE